MYYMYMYMYMYVYLNILCLVHSVVCTDYV